MVHYTMEWGIKNNLLLKKAEELHAECDACKDRNDEGYGVEDNMCELCHVNLGKYEDELRKVRPELFPYG